MVGVVSAPPLAQTDPWAAVRAEFELDPEWKHFAGFLLAPHPRIVRDAIERHRRALDRNTALYVEEKLPVYNDAIRAAAGAFLGADPNEIALTDSTTMGLGTVYGGFMLQPGQEILTTTHDHYSTHEALRMRAERDGLTLHEAALYDHGGKANEAEIVERFTAALTPKTRLVAITWVHSSTGVRLPVRAMSDALAKLNANRDPADRAILCVDGVHGFGVDDFRVADLGCDFFIAGCHKWIFGPRGTGLIWGRKAAWELVRPSIPPFEMQPFRAWIQGKTPSGPGAIMSSPGGFHSFEHRWAVAEAFEFHDGIGRAAIGGRIHALNRQLKEGLAQMKHVELFTPISDELSAGMTTFVVQGMKPDEVAKRLHAKKIFATTTPYANSYARLAPGILNTPEEVDVALSEIAALAPTASPPA
jgi:selenocysteine lyase/cysteine desulfurase